MSMKVWDSSKLSDTAALTYKQAGAICGLMRNHTPRRVWINDRCGVSVRKASMWIDALKGTTLSVTEAVAEILAKVDEIRPAVPPVAPKITVPAVPVTVKVNRFDPTVTAVGVVSQHPAAVPTLTPTPGPAAVPTFTTPTPGTSFERPPGCQALPSLYWKRPFVANAADKLKALKALKARALKARMIQ